MACLNANTDRITVLIIQKNSCASFHKVIVLKIGRSEAVQEYTGKYNRERKNEDEGLHMFPGREGESADDEL